MKKNFPSFFVHPKKYYNDFKNLCKIYNITAIPTVVILKKGKEISRINGMPLTAAFKKVFADICMSDTLNIGA